MKYNILFKKNNSDESFHPFKFIKIKIFNFISFITFTSHMDIISDYINYLLE